MFPMFFAGTADTDAEDRALFTTIPEALARMVSFLLGRVRRLEAELELVRGERDSARKEAESSRKMFNAQIEDLRRRLKEAGSAPSAGKKTKKG